MLLESTEEVKIHFCLVIHAAVQFLHQGELAALSFFVLVTSDVLKVDDDGEIMDEALASPDQVYMPHIGWWVLIIMEALLYYSVIITGDADRALLNVIDCAECPECIQNGMYSMDLSPVGIDFFFCAGASKHSIALISSHGIMDNPCRRPQGRVRPWFIGSV